MKMYIKGERRYTEATASQILEATSDLLMDLGVDREAAVLLGMSRMAKASHEFQAILEAKRVDNQLREERAILKVGQVPNGKDVQ
jgi:hypothetical protein